MGLLQLRFPLSGHRTFARQIPIQRFRLAPGEQ
jgi:hypothetical protein